MEGFARKEAGGETLGSELRAARERSGLGIAELAHALRVQEKHLVALESGDYRALPEPVYQRMFLQALSKPLGLDAKALLELHAREIGETIGVKPTISEPPCRKSAFGFLVMPRIVAALAVAAVALSSLGLLGYEVYRIVAAPALTLDSPSDGESVTAASVDIAGRTERGAELRVNGELVYLAPDGSFEEQVNLHRGVNVIKISAKKTHSDERVLYRRVLWDSPETADGGGAVAAASSSR